MKTHLTLVLLLALGGALLLPMQSRADDTATPDKGAMDKAQNLYEDNCAGCHGYEGKGDGPNAHAFLPRPANLTGTLKYGSSEDELFKTISNGVPKTAMQPWGRLLKEDEIHLIVKYVMQLRDQAAAKK
ncbi:MAG: c-type cytochrome [Candidatus Xenobia bacterium]